MRTFFGWLITLVALVLVACQPATETSPEVAVIEALEAAIDAQDLDAIVALYAEDGVVVWGRDHHHKGSKSIRELYNNTIILTGDTVDNTDFQVEGNKVLYVCTWKNREGVITARSQFEAVIENDKIKSDIWIDGLPF